MGQEDAPVFLGLELGLRGDGLFLDDSGSDVLQEGEDLHDVLVVELGGQLGQRGDQGLEQRGVLVLVVSQLLQDFIVSALDLSESDSVDHVVDQLDSLLQGGDGDGVLVVLLGPSDVLRLSLLGSGDDGLQGLIVVGLSLG